jgi:two-component system OmpR family sensor kinase
MSAVTRTGRLSLRARLLVVLIAVTAVFLLIMGGVTALVLSRRLGTQLDDSLISAAARSPQQIQSTPGGYVAVEVTHRFRPAVQPLTGSDGTTTELANAIEQLIANGIAWNYIKDTPFTVPGTAPRLRAVARVVHPNTGRGPFAVLVVAHPVGVITGQVGGIVVAELITGGALILLLALGGRWLIGRGMAPLSEMAGTAQRITTEGDLTARMPDAEPSTEVGRLGAAINTMLDRIQQAFGARLRSEAKVRQFAADASHELRTPLTTIRGYAELYRQGALDDGQLPDAMRRIEQEARRMGTLVAELLELARLDRTSSLDITETDLAVLVRDAVADARAVEPGRPVQAEAPDTLVAAVDEARIRQVLANLLGNVREHTPVTTPTAVRLGQVRGGVVLEVADAGPGMAQADAERAFDRFYRGAEQPGGGAAHGPSVGYGEDGTGYAAGSTRSPGDSANGSGPAAESGGSGLGLAIVAAIAQAHGGQATLESAPGHGTRVRVWLPAAPPAAPRATSAPRTESAPRTASAPRAASAPRLSRARRHPIAPAAAAPRPSQPGPPPRQPLSRPVGDPVPPPRQPLSRPVGDPVPPPRQPLSRPVGHPVPLAAPPAAQPWPAGQPWPAAQPWPAGQPSPNWQPRPGGYARPAELHHDWGDAPQPPAPPRQQLPPPGRHRRVERGPGPPGDRRARSGR